MRQRILGIVGVAWLVVASGACASQTIKDQELYTDQAGFRIGKNAEIQDSAKNRAVLDVVAQYQRAVSNKDFGTLKRLVADEYYSNAGTTETTDDDYGLERLPKIYEMMAQHAEKIKYKITVKRLHYKRDRALVEYEFEYAFKYKVGEKPTWDAGVDVNRLELVSEGGSWKIVSGL